MLILNFQETNLLFSQELAEAEKARLRSTQFLPRVKEDIWTLFLPMRVNFLGKVQSQMLTALKVFPPQFQSTKSQQTITHVQPLEQ